MRTEERSVCGVRERRRWRYVALVATVVCALGVAACGSSSNSSSSNKATATTAAAAASTGSTQGAAKPTGAPIKVMTIAAVHYNGPNYPNILEAATLFGKWTNDHGGINGHPLQVTTCDEQGDPNVLASCGRKAVSDGDVAVVGSFTLNGNSVIPILKAANTAWFGICCAVQADELTSTVSFPLAGAIATSTGAAIEAWKLGCRKIALVALQGLQTFESLLVANGLKAVGGKLDKTVVIPPTAQDYSPQVAQATSGTDCVIGEVSDTNWLSFLQAFQSSGAKQRLFGAQGNLDSKVAKAFPQATENAIVVGTYPDLSTPPFADFRAAIAKYNAPALDYNSLGGLGTWAGYTAFADIVSKMTGPITAASFLAAANKATVTTNGMTPPVDFTKPWTTGLPGFTRTFNRSVTYEIVHNGKLVPYNNNQFVDITNAILGK